MDNLDDRVTVYGTQGDEDILAIAVDGRCLVTMTNSEDEISQSTRLEWGQALAFGEWLIAQAVRRGVTTPSRS
ncbi:hypothetical protein DA075_10390 [Methylobacterium currus]|uniref:Uncharacterized protein n=1 Tax=Methylobacterium currus TaxID=2051553 RepID=A0A2R4WIA9_9HYPH|nr:hypothetical protein [Methylobacterium currus]AWB21269.1 hypothetical protein DA075_10390 [Methylobacterium currus]